MCPRPAEAVVIRKGLEPGCLAYGETPALLLVVVNEIVTVFCNVTGDRCRRPVGHLHAETVGEVPFAQRVLQILVIGMQSGGEII